ncbi:MAG TPA: phosphatase PAP2 family protein [Thermoanaerobaculia bacterium]|jgi:undecaprenyl-diphosphatase|nr:phosphatase PAP2 family protein [Thermoanaerobaculia bacterium]
MTSPKRSRWAGWNEPRQSELTTLLLLLVVFLGAWVFVTVADEVGEGDSRAIDRALVLALRNPHDLADPLGPGWVEESVRDFTALGGVAVLGLLTLAAAGFLWMDGKPRAAWFLLFAIGSGLALSTLLKDTFQRARPDLVAHGAIVYTSSFPSGHAMLSAVTYLTMGALLARLQQRRRLKVYLLTVAVVLTMLVGFSRVYLGVHWPTDVLAGWSAGAAWAALCWSVARVLQRRGQVESEGTALTEQRVA